ncbi:MAG: glycine/D-amino acid oxidase-like deaminating enzyme [Granulosicoccus sp.]|jgi:glycine/D-amino acid oxidase-like deaminating enzyme
MPGPFIETLPPTDLLPGKVDVVVIGGGIIGLFTALEIRERGLSVALVEKGEVGAEQSSRNWGWVRIGRRDPREIPLVVEAQRMWLDLDRRLQGVTGYTRTGIVFTAQNDTEKDRQETWLKHAMLFQIQARKLNAEQLNERFAGSQLGPMSGFYCEQDGRAEPQLTLPLLAKAVRRAGVSVLPNCAARSVETSGGRVSSVVTEKGEIKCASVVVAAGAWSSLFCRNLGIDLPQLSVLSSVLRTEPSEQTLEHALWTADFSIRKRADGGFTVASGSRSVVDIVPDSFRYAKQFLPNLKAEWNSLEFRVGERSFQELRHRSQWSNDAVTLFEQQRVRDPKPVDKQVLLGFKKLKEAFPRLADLKVAQIWAGLIDVTPDVIPVISEVDSVPGFHLATGFSGHGFGIAPGAGRLMADIVTGNIPIVDAHSFRFSRFHDGSPIILEH